MLTCRILPRICSRLPLSPSVSCMRGVDLVHFSTTSKQNDSKKSDADLEKELERLNEDLKKDFDSKVKDSEEEIDKNFMNFKAKAERDAYQRSGTIFNWKVAAKTLGIGAACLALLFYIRKIRMEEREKHIKYLAGKARIGGDWELVNTEGKLEGSEQLKGNWLLLYFGFTHCPDICPDEIEKMVKRDAYQRSGTIFNWKVAAKTLGIGAACLALLFYIRKIRMEEREKHIKYLAGKARIGGDWELVNTEGKLEGSEQLKGNWLLLYFGFTHCPDICPDEIEKMVK
ncbi:SCO1/SenC, partial [Cooperia oncophora]